MRQIVALALSVVATVFFALTAAGNLSEQSFGLTTVPASNSCELLVTGVAAGGRDTGLHAGDMIDAKALTPHERLRLMVPRATDHMMLPARRMSSGGSMAMVMVAPVGPAVSDAAYVRLGVLLLVLVLGLYVLWRGRDAASLGLGIFFATIPAFFLSHAYARLPDTAIVAVLFLATLLTLLGYLGLYLMVDALAGGTLPALLRRGGRAITGAALLAGGAIVCSSTYGRVFTGCPPLADVQIVVACYAIVIGLCFALLWRGSMGPERGALRGRLRWLFWATLVGFSGPLVSFALLSLGRTLPLGGLMNLTFLAIPIGYTYAVLRHRVIDVGFVLNRALSLTILTTGIVALFALVESVLAHFAVGHAESMVLQIGFSLGLGMIFNPIHAWFERRLERLLFRRRYQLEESLRALGEHAAAFADEDGLLAAAVAALHTALALSGCAIYRAVGEQFRLAAAAGATAFADDLRADALGFPIGVAGKVYGRIVLAEDPQAEALAAEEIHLIRSLAMHLSAAIAVLRADRYERSLQGG